MRLLLAAVLAAACAAGAGADERTHARHEHPAPHHRPPSLPVYRGRVLPVPRAKTQFVNPMPRQPSLRPGPEPSRPSRSVHPLPATRTASPLPRTPSVRPNAEPPRAATGGQLAPSRPVLFRPPDRDQHGRPLMAQPVANAARAVDLTQKTVALPAFARAADALAKNKKERDGKFHWHKHGDLRYSHWHDDRRDRDWYGFYEGDRCLWTTYWGGRFWWREPRSARWLGYWRNHWWWRSPQNVTYVFLDDSYYEWVPGATGVALLPAPPEAPAEAPETAPAVVSSSESLVVSTRPEFHYSADGTRVVEVEGEKLSAYLYDSDPATRDSAKPLQFLGDGVTAVDFTDVSDGAPLRVVVSRQVPGGGIETLVYDKDGAPVSEAPPPPPSEPTVVDPGNEAPDPDVLPPGEPPFADGE